MITTPNNDLYTTNEYDLPVLTREGVRVEWVDLDEREDMDNDESPRVLRFDLSRLVDGEWVEVEDGSYCTLVPVKTDPELLRAGLRAIMDEVFEQVRDTGRAKRLAQKLSWTGLSQLKQWAEEIAR